MKRQIKVDGWLWLSDNGETPEEIERGAQLCHKSAGFWPESCHIAQSIFAALEPEEQVVNTPRGEIKLHPSQLVQPMYVYYVREKDQG